MQPLRMLFLIIQYGRSRPTIPNELAIDSEIVTRCNRGKRDSSNLIASMRAVIESEPLARVDCIAITHMVDLDPIETIGRGEPLLVSLAVFVGEIRLVDNIVLNGEL
jgi:pantothenate synthetase